MSAATARSAPRFVRRTHLGSNEYHTNFRKIDCETISRLTSEEAGRVTSQMCRVYLSLLNAPADCWERDGVLRFAGEERGGEWVTAWGQLVSLLGVASATARKALCWMHEQGIIGYYAGKNGVGIRVFLNRAANSIGLRALPGQKILRLAPASNEAARASSADTPFRDSFADSEVLEIDLNPRAPKNGAGQTEVVNKRPDPATLSLQPGAEGPGGRPPLPAPPRVEVPVDEIVSRLRCGLEPSLRAATREAAASENEQMREWLEHKGLPKAARVAQREAYNVLRQHGLVGKAAHARAGLEVGRQGRELAGPRPLSPEEVRELAETCVAMLEVHGQPVEATLAALSAEAGGDLLAEDAPRVRQLAETLARAGGKE